jgi:hypothetical protein
MAQLSPQKRKKRRVQLREAQRRRRARLKEDSKSFLQIILSQDTLLALRNYSESVGKPLHTSAAELIERCLRQTTPPAQPDPAIPPSETESEKSNGMHSEQIPDAGSEDQPNLQPQATSSQMDLFGTVRSGATD